MCEGRRGSALNPVEVPVRAKLRYLKHLVQQYFLSSDFHDAHRPSLWCYRSPTDFFLSYSFAVEPTVHGPTRPGTPQAAGCRGGRSGPGKCSRMPLIVATARNKPMC